MRGSTVILLSCFALASSKHVKSNAKSYLQAQRDMVPNKNDLNPYKQFNLPGSNLDSGLQPPPYMNSLLNQVLDVRGGGHMNYLNVYPSSWTTNQVNSELTVDVQFTALVNNQNVHCAAHICASTPPGSNGSPTLVPAGSTVSCTASTAGGGNPPPLPPVWPTGYPNNQGFETPGYGVHQFPGAMMPQPQLYNRVPPYLVPQEPQVVYRTKFVPISVPTLVRPPPVPLQPPMPLPSNPYVLPGGPMRGLPYNPTGASLGIAPYNGLPNDVIPPVNYIY